MSRQLLEYHPTFGYRFIPHLKARVPHEGGGYLLRTNAAGFRCDHEFDAARPDGTKRILLFGDSYTAGSGVSNRDRYGDQLERLIPGLQVFNFGLPGSAPDQHYLIWREAASELEFDAVVIAVMVENIRRVAARYRPFRSNAGHVYYFAKPYFTLERKGELKLHNVPVPKDPLSPGEIPSAEQGHVDRGGRWHHLRQWSRNLSPKTKEALQKVTRYQPLPEYGRKSHPHWKLLKTILTRWSAEVPVPVLIVPLPLYQYVEETSSAKAYRRRFAELAHVDNVRVHDPLPDFHAVPLEERRQFRFEHDVHPTSAAHQVIATSLARALRPLIVNPDENSA